MRRRRLKFSDYYHNIITEELADIYNVPAGVVNSAEDIQKIREARAQQVQQDRELEMISSGADSMEKVSKAEKNLKGGEETSG